MWNDPERHIAPLRAFLQSHVLLQQEQQG
jgi:hypothetical protein